MEVMENEIFFVIIGNDQWIISENIRYLNRLVIPKNMKVEYIVASDTENIAALMQKSMRQSAAKYKIYLDQNTFIVNKNFLEKAISVFQKNSDIGMLGARGFYKLKEKNEMQSCGNYICNYDDGRNICISNVREGNVNTIVDVMALDEHFMMTSVDSDWNGNNKNFQIAKSVEMRHAGYRTAVLIEREPFVLFDNGIIVG